MSDPIAYTYEADTHCPPCTEARFGRGFLGWIAYDDEAGPSVDREGNPVGVIAPWDEWCDADSPDEQVLACGTCHGIIAKHSHGEHEPEDDPRVDHMPTVEDNY